MPPVTATSRQGEFRFKQETVANEAIATPSTFWAASPKKIKVWGVKPPMGYDVEDDPSLVLHSHEDRARLLLAKNPAQEFMCWLTGLSAAAPAQDDLGLLLKGALGGESVGPAATAVDATNAGTGATSNLKVTTTAGVTVGQACKIVTANQTFLRVIKAIPSGTTLTLDQDLDAVYTSGTVYFSLTNFPNPAPLYDLNDAGHLTFATLWRAAHSEEQIQARGVFFGIELADIGAKKRAKLAVKAPGQDYDYVSGVAVGTSFSEPQAPVQVKNGLYINPQGTVTLNNIHTSDIDIKLGLELLALPSPHGENGVHGHLVLGGRTTLEFTTYFDVDWFNWFESRQAFYAGYQIGHSALISFPQLTIDEAPEPVGEGANPRGVRVKMHADIGPLTSSELTKARFALHRFYYV